MRNASIMTLLSLFLISPLQAIDCKNWGGYCWSGDQESKFIVGTLFDPLNPSLPCLQPSSDGKSCVFCDPDAALAMCKKEFQSKCEILNCKVSPCNHDEDIYHGGCPIGASDKEKP